MERVIGESRPSQYAKSHSDFGLIIILRNSNAEVQLCEIAEIQRITPRAFHAAQRSAADTAVFSPLARGICGCSRISKIKNISL